MAEYYEYITGQGVIVPDTSTVLSEIQEMFRTAFGADIDLSATTPQGRLVEMFQRNRTFCIQICALVSNMLNLNRATGFVLDDLGSLFLLERHPATHTQTSVTMTGVSGTIVPAGTRLQTTDGDVFQTTQQYIIGTTVNVIAESEEFGAIPCSQGTLTVILDRVNGLETVTNGVPVLGSDLESDADFRARIKESLNVNSIAILSSIKSNLMAVDGVKDSYCYDNYEDSSVVVDSITIPAHSVLACVEGGDDMEVAKIIYEKKTIGTGYIADTETNAVKKMVVDEAYGTAYPVVFMRPITQAIDVVISVNRQGYSGADLESAVKDAVMQWYNGGVDGVDGIKIGKSVSPFEISAALSDVLPDIFITSVGVAQHGSTPSSETLSFGSVHKATLDRTNITVTVTQ